MTSSDSLQIILANGPFAGMRCRPAQRRTITMFVASKTYISPRNCRDTGQKLFSHSSPQSNSLPRNMASKLMTEIGLFDKTLTQVEELTKMLSYAHGTNAIPSSLDRLLQKKLELLSWCEPDLVNHVDTQIARLDQLVDIRVRLDGGGFPDSTWSDIDNSLKKQLKRVLSLFSQEKDWRINVLDVLSRTRHNLMQTNIDINWVHWEKCYRKLTWRFLKETEEKIRLEKAEETEI